MTELFKTYMKAAINKNDAAYVQKLAATIPAELKYNHNGKTEQIRKLLSTEALESGLIQTEAHKTVLEGAQPTVCLRSAMNVVPMNSLNMSWPLGESGITASGTYSQRVAEGAEIPVRTQDYSTLDFVAKKYAERVVVSSELKDDTFINLMDQELRFAGSRIENQLNQDAITELIDTCATNEVDGDISDGTTGLDVVADALGKVRAAGFNPDTFIMHPEMESVIMKDDKYSTSYFTEGMLKTGVVPRVYNMDTYTCGVIDNGTQEWGYTNAGEIGGIVFDSKAIGAIGMRMDMNITEYEDPIRDASGATIISRFDVEVAHELAGARIQIVA